MLMPLVLDDYAEAWDDSQAEAYGRDCGLLRDDRAFFRRPSGYSVGQIFSRSEFLRRGKGYLRPHGEPL